MKRNIKLKNNKGYTLLFAVLVASIVLSVGISILTISKKEFLLSSSARESTTAFYAADSGLECALYNDYINDTFSTSTSPATVNCIKKDFNITKVIDPNTRFGTTTFHMSMSDGQACAIVKVSKSYYTDINLGYIPRTIVESRGYNVGWVSGANNTCSKSSARRVERAIRYTF